MRNQRIEVSRELKTAMRREAVAFDGDGNPTRFENREYMPAHVWIIRLRDGKEFQFHHDNRDKLFDGLSVPSEDSNEGGPSGAVLIKLNNYKADNVRVEYAIRDAALQRFTAAVRSGTLVATVQIEATSTR